ncbi:MAG: ATP synthase F0 subunit B [Thermodesulfobacteriota bacterium]
MLDAGFLAAAGEAAGTAPYFNWTYVGKHAFNLAVLIGILYYVLRKPVSGFLKSRRKEMVEKFEESGRKLNEAKKIFEQCSEKLDGVKAETDSLKSTIAAQAQNERENIIRRARAEKEAILKETAESIESAAARARASIRREAVAAAMSIAERKLKESGGGSPVDIKSFESAVEEGKWLRSRN